MSLLYRDRHQEVREENICLRISGLLCVCVPSAYLLRNVKVFAAGHIHGVPLLCGTRLVLPSRKEARSSLVSYIVLERKIPL